MLRCCSPMHHGGLRSRARLCCSARVRVHGWAALTWQQTARPAQGAAPARQTLRARQHGRRSAPPSTWRTRLPLAVAHAGTRGRAAAVRTRAARVHARPFAPVLPPARYARARRNQQCSTPPHSSTVSSRSWRVGYITAPFCCQGLLRPKFGWAERELGLRESVYLRAHTADKKKQSS